MSRVAVLLVIALASATAVPAQGPPSLERWLGAVRQHTPGELDEPARVAGSWSSGELRDLLDALKDTRDRSAERDALLLRAAVLHADVAILARDRIIRAEPGDRFVTYARDGRLYGNMPIDPSWGFGRLLLAELSDDQASREIARLWYHATMAHLAVSGQLAAARPHLDRARQMFPRDPVILFDSGWLFEEYVSPGTLASAEEMAAFGSRGLRADLPGRGEALQRAERFYSEALDAAPGFAGARVHRGRVRALRGNHAGAIQDLRAVVLAPERDAHMVRYWAALFLGGVHDARDEIAQARDAYTAAAKLYPLAQSPHLALSRLATRRGDMLTAQREVQEVLKLSPAEPNRGDPWWTYGDGSGARAEALLAQLRQVIAKVTVGS